MLTFLPWSLGVFRVVVFSRILGLSRSRFLLIWIRLEINLLTVVPLLIGLNKKIVIRGIIYYFIFQAIGSAVLLFGICWGEWGCTLGLLTKLGAAPFHWWIPKLFVSLNWPSILIVSTWQKLLPVFILSLRWFNLGLLTVCLISRALWGSIRGLAQTQIKSILAYSSITHLRWILYALLRSSNSLIWYWVIYSLINVMLCLRFYEARSDSRRELSTAHSVINLLSLAGLPPFLGFIIKLMLITGYISWILLPLIIGSVIRLFYYLNIRINLIFNNLKLGADRILIPRIFLNIGLPILLIIGMWI